MKVILAIHVPEDASSALAKRLGHGGFDRRKTRQATHEEIVAFLQYWIDEGWDNLRHGNEAFYPPLEDPSLKDESIDRKGLRVLK